jgi:hypothetical protein
MNDYNQLQEKKIGPDEWDEAGERIPRQGGSLGNHSGRRASQRCLWRPADSES